MPAPDPLLGTLVGSIRIQSRLGAGAMGVVYRGRHEVLNKDVAVKVLLQARGNAEHARQRFLREGQAAAKIAHPNVVQVFEAGVANGTPFLVMELVIGHSLGSLLDEVSRKAGKPTGLPPETVARLGAGIALGLQAIHTAGVVHRDIKPDNVMVAADRSPKVADLGLAKEIADPDALRLTGTGMVVGTPLYCAPEAIRNPQDITPAADIYSFGATLYHMVAGKPPFDGATAYNVMRAHLEDRPKPLREVVPGTPASLSNLVDLCLEKEPKRRPTAMQIAEALAGGTALKSRQRIGLAALAMVGAIAVLGGAGGAWWLLHTTPQSAVAPANALLVIQAAHPHVRVRIDGGAWQPATPEGLSVAPGKHQVEVEAHQPGPALRWTGSVELAPSALFRQPVDLQTTTVPEQRLVMPGAGMLYVAGEATSLEPTVSVTFSGTWPIARWDGGLWRTRTYEVDSQGRQNLLGEGVRDLPGGEAWWQVCDREGQPIEPRHVICWWEADRIRAAAKLGEPPGWVEQGRKPAQPALRMRSDLVDAILGKLSEVRLPERRLASAYAVELRQPVWFRTANDRPSLVGGGAETVAGCLVVVPR
jgi:tRNA A-37 threonylcarbamoyl transferase component Bud32